MNRTPVEALRVSHTDESPRSDAMTDVTSRLPWSPAQRRKNDVIYAIARQAIGLGLSLPRAWLAPAGTWLGLLAHALFRDARETTLANLALVHPELDLRDRARLARDVYRTLGKNLTDSLALLDPREDPMRTLSVSAESERVLAAALEERRGVVYATCHLGPWERMAALLAKRGFPITTIARESYDPRFHALVYDRLRAHRDVHVIYRGAPSAPLSIVRTLRQGRVLGLLADLPGRVPARPVTWLGKPARIASGVARIALRVGSPVVVGTPAPAPAKNGLEIRIEAIPTSDLSSDDRGEAELSQRIADALSTRVRLLPTHWPWMFPTFAATETRIEAAETGVRTEARTNIDERARTVVWPRVGV
ncbi:MAG: lysophospholipid acyltransferase family protein [Polyangiaceae bacterium]